ncbi:hypothetical protein N7G274_009389 [Stereocaulon virgatum]|uniref:GED domain-containing protein n=1 Tax=Stereocaulon virgatum TaxID=373712 RepID=A0ABR3ZXJ8_9LECA
MDTYPMPPGSWLDIVDNPLLDHDAFQNEKSRRHFDTIDRLRSSGANQDIALPELVIVGDQSAGKSSLLQSLTDIPFPVASNVCTRFPTRIISRRTPGRRETTTVSIEPKVMDKMLSHESLESRLERFAAFDTFKRSFSTMTKADFMKAIDDAAEAMGIGGSTRDETTRTSPAQTEEINFSDDVLKVEISGPDRSHFSILDVPGIFHSVTRTLTEKDKKGVDKMVNSYMRSPQSIIICVANGTNDLGPQAIFGMVERLDKDHATLERTVGVITKCDATQRVKQVIETAQNIDKPLRHGWFVVRNRTPSEVDQGVGPLERSQKEQAFFSKPPWSGLPEERRGTQALKKYLASLLCTRIEQNFPTFLKTIQNSRVRAASDLQNLSVGRTTMEQNRAYLTRIAHDFNSLVMQGLRGRYDGLTGNDAKLRMKIRDANDQFVQEMNKNGHFLPFVEETTGENMRKPPSVFPSSGGFSSAQATTTTDQPKSSSVCFGGSGSKPEASNVSVFGPGTLKSPLVVEFQEKDTKSSVVYSFQAITSMNLYRRFSFEELRLSHYLQFKSSTLKKEQPRSSFGAPAKEQSSGLFGAGLFGAPAKEQPRSSFGAPTKEQSSGLFGAPAKEQSSGLFGAPAKEQSSGLFGAPAKEQSSGLFGAPAKEQPRSSFGAPAKEQSSGLFGRPTEATTSQVKKGIEEQSKVPRSDEERCSLLRFSTTEVFGRKSPDSNSTHIGSTGLFQTEPKDVYEWIRDEIKSNRGTELQGTMNPDVLPILFHKQARKWRSISKTHFENVTKIAFEVLRHVLQSECKDSHTRALIEIMIDKANKRSKDGFLTLLSERMDVILSRHLQTNNPAFKQKVSEARKKRFHAALERYKKAKGRGVTPVSQTENPSGGPVGSTASPADDDQLVIDMRDTGALFEELHMSNSQNLEDEVHDTLKAYYELARDDFVEYVNQLIVESYLDDPKGPVLFFCPVYVAGLKDEEIEALAAEDEKTVIRRKTLEETIARLDQAEKIAREYDRPVQ